jgi:hypothetical protein
MSQHNRIRNMSEASGLPKLIWIANQNPTRFVALAASYLTECEDLQSDRSSSTFRRNTLPPYSISKTLEASRKPICVLLVSCLATIPI